MTVSPRSCNLSPLEALFRQDRMPGPPAIVEAAGTVWRVPGLPFRAWMTQPEFFNPFVLEEVPELWRDRIAGLFGHRVEPGLSSDQDDRTAFIVDHPGIIPEKLLPVRVFTTRLVRLAHYPHIHVVPTIPEPAAEPECEPESPLLWLDSAAKAAGPPAKIDDWVSVGNVANITAKVCHVYTERSNSAAEIVAEFRRHGTAEITVLQANGETARAAIANHRCVAFPAADEHAPDWLALCLRWGRIPIVTGAAVTLPFDEHIDYAEAVPVLGDSPAELRQLTDFAALTSAEFTAMQERGRAIWEQAWRPDRIRARIQTILAEQRSTDVWIPETVSNPFPAFTEDGAMLREADLFRTLWLKLGREFPADRAKPILCWGAGRFLKRMLAAVQGLPHGPALLGVADDAAEPGQKVGELQVARAEHFPRNTFSAVLPATDAIEDALAARCQAVYGNDVRIVRPSEWMRPEAVVATDAPNSTYRNFKTGRDGSPSRPVPESRMPRRGIPALTGMETGDRKSDMPVLRRGRGACLKKLEAVIACVGYGDMLSWSLPWNRPQFDTVAIVTAPDDRLTRSVAEKHGARVVISERYREKDPAFNKGKMLNDGIAALDFDDWVLITDADILFPSGLRRRLAQRKLHRDALYYATRVDAPDDDLEHWLLNYFKQPERGYGLPFREPGRNRMPWGYFQLVHASAQTLAERGRTVYDESFDTACDVDYAFQDAWPNALKILLPELTIHIPHGTEGANWRGRTSCPLPTRPA